MKRSGLIGLVGLAACTLSLNPFFNGKITGYYTYQTVINGVNSEVSTTISFDVKATFENERRYAFAGTAELYGETYRIEGTETYPPGVKGLRPQQVIRRGVQADLFEDDTLVYKLCSPLDSGYGAEAELDVYPGTQPECEAAGGKLGTINFLYD